MTETPVADRVVMVLFDGLRPEFATAERMPRLAAFLAGCRRFPDASSAFPSLTRVCAATIATGAPPAVHGIVHNAFPDPAAAPGRFLDTASVPDMRAASRHHGPAFAAAPRLADALAAHRRRFALVHSGSGGGAWLIDPRARENGSFVLSLAGREACEVPEAWDLAIARLGTPPADKPALVLHAARAVTEVAWPEARPDATLLWLTEPDWSFHYRGLDSPATRAALRAADGAFGIVLDAVERDPDSERTAVMALSDHGHVGTEDPFDPLPELAALGLRAALDRRGPDLSVGAGTALWLWPEDDSPARLARLADALRERPWCGTLFSRGGDKVEGGVPGTLGLALLNADHPRAAPLVVGLRGGEGPDRWGLPGLSPMVGKDLLPGGGMHGGLHRREMAILLALRAHGLQPGADEQPAGLTDVAPTVLGLLGLPAPDSMTGRSLLAPRPPRARRRVETGRGGHRQELELAGEGLGAVAREAGRLT